ncbi:hypothetical protein [Streptomyces sp. NPDC088725]|uniref:hypothetical protein n=1 Tax=Streptomyces sp. NPDC088725 TaxID=3365873 RepID=UPI003807DDE3
MEFDTLRYANFAALDETVKDWSSVIKSLTRLEKDARDDMKSKAEKASWAGVNATVSRQFIDKTAGEFTDAVSQATSIRDILKDTREKLADFQKKLNAAVGEMEKQSIYITDQGHAIATLPSGAAAGSGTFHQPTEEELDSAQRRVADILWEADEADRIANRALRALAKGDYGFSDGGPSSLKEADRRQGKEDAEYWAKKAAKGHADEWSDEDLQRFNDVLKNQRDNPAFTETFATRMGADGTLQFWRDLADPGHGQTPEGDRAKLLEKVQGNLSMSLANATHGHTPAMEAWKNDILAAGGKQFSHDGVMTKPYGFQIMSSLMSKGKFDTEFLNSYGDKMVEFERDFTGKARNVDAGWLWDHPTRQLQLSYPPDPDGVNDPMAGFMEALGHNPEASVNFFNASTGEGEEVERNWDYLFGKDEEARKWPADTDAKEDLYGKVGHALESATSGVPHGSDTPPGKHSADSSLLVQKIVKTFGSDPKLIEEFPMSSSLGNITAEYMRDVQDGLNGEREIPTYGSNANLGGDPAALKNFLAGVGKDPDAYGAILNSQQAVTTELINETYQDRDKFKELSAEVSNKVAPGIEISGIMAESRTQSVYDDKIASDAEFNEGITNADMWVGRVIDMGIGKIPVGGDVVSTVTGDIREAVLDHYTRDSSEEAAQERDAFLERQRKSSAAAVYDATYTAAIEAGIDPENAASNADAAQRQASSSYSQGRQRATG